MRSFRRCRFGYSRTVFPIRFEATPESLINPLGGEIHGFYRMLSVLDNSVSVSTNCTEVDLPDTTTVHADVGTRFAQLIVRKDFTSVLLLANQILAE